MKRTINILKLHPLDMNTKIHAKGIRGMITAAVRLVCCVFQSFFKGTWDRFAEGVRTIDLYASSAISDYTNKSNPGSIDKASTAHVPNNKVGEPVKTSEGEPNNNKAKSTENERISQLNHSYNMKYKIIKVTEVTQETFGEGRKRSHRRVVCTTPDNQSFAFHLWGAMALDFEGKEGDVIRAEYRSRVHVSRSGIYHTNLSLVDYDVIHRKADPDDYQFIIKPNASKPSCEIGIRGIDYPYFDDPTIDYDYAVGTNNKEINYEGQCKV